MKSRLDENQGFLERLAKSKSLSKTRKQILRATDEEIKTIIECIVNIHRLPFSVDEEKCLKRNKRIVNQLIKQIVKKIYLNLNKAKKFLIKHARVLKLIISCILTLAIQFDITSVLTNGESIQSDESGEVQ
jgi:hypothetical protein